MTKHSFPSISTVFGVGSLWWAVIALIMGAGLSSAPSAVDLALRIFMTAASAIVAGFLFRAMFESWPSDEGELVRVSAVREFQPGARSEKGSRAA